jgi:hypothetical protein
VTHNEIVVVTELNLARGMFVGFKAE